MITKSDSPFKLPPGKGSENLQAYNSYPGCDEKDHFDYSGHASVPSWLTLCRQIYPNTPEGHSPRCALSFLVMAGLDPAIHDEVPFALTVRMDHRIRQRRTARLARGTLPSGDDEGW